MNSPRTPMHPTFADGPNNPAAASPHLSPILTVRPLDNPLVPSQPEYAEILTPLKLRRRRRQALEPVAGPSSLPGPSKQGYTTEEGDVYRGATYDPRLDPPAIDEDAVTLGGTSTTSSSSSWSWASDIERGRRATLAVIGRFGERLRRRGSGSSGASTISDNSGIVNVMRKRSRRLSRSTTRDSSPERPKRQHLPRRREFTLLLPPTDSPNPISRIGTPMGSATSDECMTPMHPPDRLITTPSLPVVLDHVRSLRAAAGIRPDTPSLPDIAMRKGGSGSGRTRPKFKHGTNSFPNPPVPRPQRTMSRVDMLRMTDVPRPKSVSDLMGMNNPYGSSTSTHTLKADKATDNITLGRSPAPSRQGSLEQARGGWWLDVSCPGWEDLRDIGEVLGLHPLTLEDVLQQDPREKFDTFDRLGYYFVVVRALDEGYFKYTPGSATTLVGAGEKAVLTTPTNSPTLRANNDKKKEGRRRGWGMGRATGKTASKEGEKVEIVEDNPGKEGLEGVGVGALNVYLVVFADGIISFHFEDITKHTRRVLDRILSKDSIKEAPGADEIAHGLLDSIVDAFFPLVRYVDGEVDDIDSLSIDPSTDPKAHPTPPPPPSSEQDSIEMNEKGCPPPSSPPAMSRTQWIDHVQGVLPRVRFPHWLVFIRLFLLPTTNGQKKHYEQPDQQIMTRSQMIKHITHMRKVVTGLTRLLGAKHAVVGEMRKRMAEQTKGFDAYIGDVEDHILLLQNSLLHYEYILSHCQPAYLSHLSVSFGRSKGRSDQAILALSTVAIGILPMQLIVTMFGMNIHVPNETGGNDSLHAFATIIVVLLVIICGLVMLIRYWRWNARRTWTMKRGADLPSTWDGFWGFR